MALTDDDKRWITDTVRTLIRQAMFARHADGALTPVEALRLLADQQQPAQPPPPPWIPPPPSP